MAGKKRWTGLFLFILIGQLIGSWTLADGAVLKTKEGESLGPAVTCKAYCVMDGDTGEILFSKNADKAYPPASITKVLTALIVAEQCDNLDTVILVPEKAFEDLELVSSTLTPSARAMEQLTVRDLLYGMILSSGNECASALACYVSGSMESFAALMNGRARQAGAVSSHFVNAHGLDAPSHKVTASDMARIFRAALENPLAREVLSAKEYTIAANAFSGERHLTMGHAMVNGTWQADGVYAGKTGYTVKAGRTLVTAAERAGRNLLIVTMGSEAAAIYYDTQILMDYSFTVLEGLEWKDAPLVSGLQVARSDQEGCIITGWVNDVVTRVEVPAWSEADGQDDLMWGEARLEGNQAIFELNCSDHGGEKGLYTVIFYGYTADERKFGVSAHVLVTGNALVPGKMQWNGSSYYILEDKTPAIGMCETKDGVFLADNMGRLQTGLVLEDNAITLLEEDTGRMIDGWKFWNGNFYYMQKSGEAAIGAMQIDGRLYQFDQGGRLQSGMPFPWVLHQILSER